MPSQLWTSACRKTARARIMEITTIIFYCFALVLVLAALKVITAKNPVHAALFLVLSFFTAAAIWMLLKAEFLAITLVLVYVGAVMVLFLFVVMMLDVNFAELREGVQRYAPVGATVGAVLFVELVLVLGGWSFAPESGALRLSTTPGGVSNTHALGRLIYTDYVFLFQAAGLILFVAMIGAIVLTHRGVQTTRRQSIERQNARTVADTLEIMPVGLGVGTGVTGIIRPKPARALAPAAADQPHDTGVGQPGPGEH